MTTKIEKQVSLYFKAGTSDKEYHLQLVHEGAAGYIVNFQYGRRGGTLISDTKTKQTITRERALKLFDSIVTEKTAKGYAANGEGSYAAPVTTTGAAPSAFPVELLTEISEAEVVKLINFATNYWMQVKIDGHRRQIQKLADGKVVSYNRKGQPVALPARVVADCKRVPLKSFVLDGELVGDSFVAFDLLAANGRHEMQKEFYAVRFDYLQQLLDCLKLKNLTTVATWRTSKEKTLGIDSLRFARCEGVAFKLATAPYKPGRNGQHKKFKFTKTLSAVVCEVAKDGKQSICVALEGVRVGTCSTIGKSPARVGDVVEVKYLYATEGKRLYQPVYLGLRDDLNESDCTLDQLIFKQGVGA